MIIVMLTVYRDYFLLTPYHRGNDYGDIALYKGISYRDAVLLVDSFIMISYHRKVMTIYPSGTSFH